MLILEKSHEGFGGLQAQSGAPSAPLPVVGSWTNGQLKKIYINHPEKSCNEPFCQLAIFVSNPSTEQLSCCRATSICNLTS